MLGAVGVIILGVSGLIGGWFVGQGLDTSGLMDAETFWKTDPENMWAWSAIFGGVLGVMLGLTIMWFAGISGRDSRR